MFFPSDCSKTCLFSELCAECEMEVSYYVALGTEEAGCSLRNLEASACKCEPLDSQELLQDCRLRSSSLLRGKYRCHQIVCQISPLYGTQPLKVSRHARRLFYSAS